MDASLQQQYGLPIGSYYDSGSGYVVDPWGNPLGAPQQFGGTQPNGPGGEWSFPQQQWVETAQYGQLQTNPSAQAPAAANIGDFTTGADLLQKHGYAPGSTDYEGVTTSYFNPQTGQLAYWYGDLSGGSSTTHDSGAAAWHSASELAPQQGVDSSGNIVNYTPTAAVLQPRAEDPQLVSGAKGAAGVLAGVLAPQLIGALAAAMPAAESGIALAEMASEGSGIAASTTAANQMLASAVVRGLSTSLSSALGGATLEQALASGAITAALPYITQGVSAELQGMTTADGNPMFSPETIKSLAGVTMQTLGGAAKGAVSGGSTGAEAGALTGAATAGIGEAAGAAGSAAVNEFSPPQTLDFLGTEYVVDADGNFVLNGKGDPMTVDEYTASNKQAFSTFAQKVGSPFISQNISNLFASTPDPAAAAPASTATQSSGSVQQQATTPKASSTSASTSANTAPTLTGQGVYSTPTFNTGGSTLGGSTQGSPGTQALAQALNVGNPASATSDTGDTSSSNETGGSPQAVWNTASLKVKDALGGQENV